MSARRWNPWTAQWLLAGIDPDQVSSGRFGYRDDDEAFFDHPEAGRYPVLSRILVEEFRGLIDPLTWHDWSPRRWLAAARKAGINIPDELLPWVPEKEPPLHASERRTLLCIIETLAAEAGLVCDPPVHEARRSALLRHIKILAAEAGVDLSRPYKAGEAVAAAAAFHRIPDAPNPRVIGNKLKDSLKF